MIIWGRPLNIDIFDLLADIREEATKKYKTPWLFENILNRGDDVFVSCPCIENHGGVPERTPSCSIHKETGMVHCFGCDYTDTIPGTIAKVLHLTNRIQGYRWLLRKYTMPIRGERPSLKVGLHRRVKSAMYSIPDEILDLYAFDHPYMFQRGLTREVIDWLDLGYDKSSDSITIPMRDLKGNILFIKKRPIKRTKFHKYHIDEGVDKRDTVFGLDLVFKSLPKVKRVFLCEGEMDVASYYCIHEYAIGLQGSKLFPEQVKQLVKVIRGIPIVLAFDNDKAGETGVMKAIELLRPYFPLSRIVYPKGFTVDGKKQYKDPNDLLKKDLLRGVSIVKV